MFHNLENYDAHLIMQGLQGPQEGGKLLCIAKNSEKYISFSLGQLRFIDLFNFMASSLDKLVKACPKEYFTLLRSKFSDDSDSMDLLLQKGYTLTSTWILLTSLKKLDCHPSNSFTVLSNSDINEEYLRAQRVWEMFQTKNLGDYHDLYMYVTTDVFY